MPSHPSYPGGGAKLIAAGRRSYKCPVSMTALVGAASRRDDGYDDTAGRNTVNRSNG